MERGASAQSGERAFVKPYQPRTRSAQVKWEQSVPCPKCRDPVGAYCRAANGIVRTYVHTARLRANKTPCPVVGYLTYSGIVVILRPDSIPA